MSDTPPAVVDRRLTRFIFKIYEDRHGLAWWMPTRRFAALAILCGQIRYPADLISVVLQQCRLGTIVPYRHPYEIPEYLLVSFAPVPYPETLPLLQSLSSLDLLDLYEEGELLVAVHRHGLPDRISRQALGAGLAVHPDTVDRVLGNLGRPTDDVEAYESVIAVALAGADAEDAYPALLLSEATRAWAAEAADPRWARFAEAEAFLLDQLPARLLGFPDVAELALAAASCRERLASGPADLERLFTPLFAAAGERGVSYRQAVLGKVDGASLAPEGLGPVTGLYPGDGVMASVAAAPELAQHRSQAALDGLPEVPKLLLVPGTRLWIPPLDDFALVDIYSGRPHREVHTYAPF